MNAEKQTNINESKFSTTLLRTVKIGKCHHDHVTYMRILFFILLYTTLIENKIVIKDSGLATISRGDMAMILYVTVENVCENKYHIFVQMIKCCELFGPNDMDCHTMQLIGGDMGWLNSHSVKNISLIYPTLYLHNRFGHCLVSIIYNSSEASVNIQFNTLITQLTPELRDYCGEGNVSVCDTVDLDPLRQCEPINCQMKYLGARNYFNFKWRRCQKVPLCITDRDKSLPDVSYVPFSNQCKDLEQVNLKELQDLQQDNWKSEVVARLSPNIRCHHGKLDMDRGFCNCDKGWTTVITDGNHYEPTLSIYHMCNTQIPPQKSPIGYILFAIFVTGACLALLLLLTSLLCHLGYRYLYKSYEESAISEVNSCRHCCGVRELTVIGLKSDHQMDVVSCTYCSCCNKPHIPLLTTEPEEQIPIILSENNSVHTVPISFSEYSSDYTTEEEITDY